LIDRDRDLNRERRRSSAKIRLVARADALEAVDSREWRIWFVMLLANIDARHGAHDELTFVDVTVDDAKALADPLAVGRTCEDSWNGNRQAPLIGDDDVSLRRARDATDVECQRPLRKPPLKASRRRLERKGAEDRGEIGVLGRAPSTSEATVLAGQCDKYSCRRTNARLASMRAAACANELAVVASPQRAQIAASMFGMLGQSAPDADGPSCPGDPPRSRSLAPRRARPSRI